MCHHRVCSVRDDYTRTSPESEGSQRDGHWLSPGIATISSLVPFTSSLSAVELWSTRFRPEWISGCLSRVSSLDVFASKIPQRLLVAQSRLPFLSMADQSGWSSPLAVLLRPQECETSFGPNPRHTGHLSSGDAGFP